MIHTTEHFTCSKSSTPSLNEDALVITNSFVSVIDGATSKSSITFDGLTGGRFAAEVISTYLESIEISSHTPETLFPDLNQCLGMEARKRYPDLSHADYPRASVIILNGMTGEVWNYGDCRCRIGEDVFTHEKLIDVENSQIRSEVVDRELKNGKTVEELMEHDPGRDFIMDRLREQYRYENVTGMYGYPVLNGYNFNSELIVVHKVPSDQDVILASDGYPVLEDTLEKSEEKLCEIMREDPLCYQIWKSTKGLRAGNLWADDRTYWRGNIFG